MILYMILYDIIYDIIFDIIWYYIWYYIYIYVFFQIMDQPGEFMTLVTAAFPSSRSVCFDQMLHGWVNRGAEDPMVPQAAGGESVSEAQASALKLAAEFLQAHGAS